jgi:hypothetical protein
VFESETDTEVDRPAGRFEQVDAGQAPLAKQFKAAFWTGLTRGVRPGGCWWPVTSPDFHDGRAARAVRWSWVMGEGETYPGFSDALARRPASRSKVTYLEEGDWVAIDRAGPGGDLRSDRESARWTRPMTIVSAVSAAAGGEGQLSGTSWRRRSIEQPDRGSRSTLIQRLCRRGGRPDGHARRQMDFDLASVKRIHYRRVRHQLLSPGWSAST